MKKPAKKAVAHLSSESEAEGGKSSEPEEGTVFVVGLLCIGSSRDQSTILTY